MLAGWSQLGRLKGTRAGDGVCGGVGGGKRGSSPSVCVGENDLRVSRRTSRRTSRRMGECVGEWVVLLMVDGRRLGFQRDFDVPGHLGPAWE